MCHLTLLKVSEEVSFNGLGAKDAEEEHRVLVSAAVLSQALHSEASIRNDVVAKYSPGPQ